MSGEFTGIRGITQANAVAEGLMADFSGLQNLEKIVQSVMERLALRQDMQVQAAAVRNGALSLEEFDGVFAFLLKEELGKVLGILRNKAKQKAEIAGAGSASSAVKRRLYKEGYGGNINIAGNRKRISNKKRIVPEPTGGKSGIRKHRTVKPRTQKIREYFGPDRDFILRILENGRDVFMATPEGPTGRRSMATYGKRGSMPPRNWFFHTMKSDMELAAQQLGTSLMGAVEEWIEQEFADYNGK